MFDGRFREPQEVRDALEIHAESQLAPLERVEFDGDSKETVVRVFGWLAEPHKRPSNPLGRLCFVLPFSNRLHPLLRFSVLCLPCEMMTSGCLRVTRVDHPLSHPYILASSHHQERQ